MKIAQNWKTVEHNNENCKSIKLDTAAKDVCTQDPVLKDQHIFIEINTVPLWYTINSRSTRFLQ